MFDVLELQKKLVAALAPSGMETNCGKVLADLARPFVDEINTDHLGNIICYKKGRENGKRIFIPAHMDGIGFIVTYVDDNGYVWFDPLGYFTPATLVGESVVFQNGIQGTIYLKNITEFFSKPLAEIDTDDLYIDIGATSAEQAKAMVKLGDWAKYSARPEMIAGNCIMTPYADDLAGCIVLLLAMEQITSPQNDLFFTFTVQEELGVRGAEAAAYGVNPDMVIATDGCRTGDTPKNTNVSMEVKLGGGPAIKLKDCGMVCSALVIEHLKNAAQFCSIQIQQEIMRFGMTDASVSQRTRGGKHAGCISIPIRHMHSPCEIYNISDLKNAAKLMAQACSAAVKEERND